MTTKTNITYRSTVCKFEEFCVLGRRYQLYAKWGTMQTWYLEPERVSAMAIAYQGKTPVGMAILLKEGHGIGGIRFGVFTRRFVRRKGIGSRLVALIKKRTGMNFMVAKYDDQQSEFFESLGMRGYRNFDPSCLED